MAQSLVVVLHAVVAAADGIDKLWADKVRGLYIKPAMTPGSANRTRRRQANAQLAARQQAMAVKADVQSALDNLGEQIALALTFDAPSPISSADVESRLSDLLTSCENLVENLALDGPHVAHFQESRNRIELLAVSIAIAADDDEGEDDDDRGGQIADSRPPQPGSEFDREWFGSAVDQISGTPAIGPVDRHS
jgi:hypothetical protein